MTLAQIMKLALRQLDEDPADIDDFAEAFREYANEGYRIAVVTYLRPREMMTIETDENGRADIEGMGILHIIELTDGQDRRVWFDVSGDGTQILTNARNQTLHALCAIRYPRITDMEEPKLPEGAHMALVDYVCYRHLSNGNMAKQSRAQHYLSQFHSAIRREIPTQGGRATTAFKNLYGVTDARYARW